MRIKSTVQRSSGDVYQHNYKIINHNMNSLDLA